jgi:hypothetical protein
MGCKNVRFLIKGSMSIDVHPYMPGLKNISKGQKIKTVFVRNLIFLFEKLQFLYKNEPFLYKNFVSWYKNASFWYKNFVNSYKNEPFLYKNFVNRYKNEPFLYKNFVNRYINTLFPYRKYISYAADIKKSAPYIYKEYFQWSTEFFQRK